MFGIAVRPTTLPEHSNNIQTCTFCNGSTTLLHLALVDKNDKEDDKNAIFWAEFLFLSQNIEI